MAAADRPHAVITGASSGIGATAAGSPAGAQIGQRPDRVRPQAQYKDPHATQRGAESWNLQAIVEEMPW